MRLGAKFSLSTFNGIRAVQRFRNFLLALNKTYKLERTFMLHCESNPSRRTYNFLRELTHLKKLVNLFVYCTNLEWTKTG